MGGKEQLMIKILFFRYQSCIQRNMAIGKGGIWPQCPRMSSTDLLSLSRLSCPGHGQVLMLERVPAGPWDMPTDGATPSWCGTAGAGRPAMVLT